jgi:hypothetical protein
MKKGQPRPGRITYAKGVDEKLSRDSDFVSYGISKLVDGQVEHENIINVHGDELLRDASVYLLMSRPPKLQRME